MSSAGCWGYLQGSHAKNAQLAAKHLRKHQFSAHKSPSSVLLCRSDNAFADLCWTFGHMQSSCRLGPQTAHATDSTSEGGASCCIVHLCLTNQYEEVTSPNKYSSVVTCCEAAVAVISTSQRRHQRHVTSVPKSQNNCIKLSMKSATFPPHMP